MKYIFDKEIFRQSCIDARDTPEFIDMCMLWANVCHGKEVVNIEGSIGMVGRFTVNLDWCKEVE